MYKKSGSLRLALLFILIIAMFSQPVFAEMINGHVHDQELNPIQDAEILVNDKGTITGSTRSDESGYFEVDAGEEATLIVYADDDSTPGIDFVPAHVQIDSENRIILVDGASLVINGNVQLVDTENLPRNTMYFILDEDDETINLMGVPLEYNTQGNIFRKIPSYDEEHLIVPANTKIKVRINATLFLRASDQIDVSVVTEIIETPPQGRITQLEVSKYTYPINQDHTFFSMNELTSQLEEMANYGFYLERHEAALQESMNLLDEASSFRDRGENDEAFSALKRSFIISSHAIQELNAMFQDARVSTSILIGFLAISSLTLGYFLKEKLANQIAADLIIFLFAGIIFYFVYPGGRIISSFDFVLSSIGYMLFFGLSGYLLPKLFGNKGYDERVHTRNILTPIFNIAKRSLRRRRLRFLLTLTSLTLLVMSFVTLTSFSESYGLITAKKNISSDWEGVVIRAGTWIEDSPAFILLDQVEENWLRDIAGIAGINIKAENTPQRTSFIELGNAQITGILGVSDGEAKFVSPTIVAGGIPDDNGIMISESLARSIDASIGDIVNLPFFDLEIQGLIDDEAFSRLKDVDGSDYVPNKWTNISPPGEPARYILKPCEPGEIIILSINNAIKMPATGIQQLGLELIDPSAGPEIAEKLSLERGYRSLAVLPDEQILVRLGNYFEGRGFTLLIPWIIVVLNVIITMTNSMFERSGEIEILSSVGLNPAQVSAIFLAEATIIGFIAGGLGYLIGIGGYKIITILNVGLYVNQKISALWSVASIALSISAVLSGSFIALKNSVVITPSLMRRWRVGQQANLSAPFEVIVPVKLLPDEVIPYRDFILKRIGEYRDHPEKMTSTIKYYEIENGWRISFIYKSTTSMTGNFYTSNNLYITMNGQGEYEVKLMSRGESEWAHDIGTLIRLISMDFSTKKDE